MQSQAKTRMLCGIYLNYKVDTKIVNLKQSLVASTDLIRSRDVDKAEIGRTVGYTLF